MATSSARLTEILQRHEADILRDWLEEQGAAGGRLVSMMTEAERREQSRELLASLRRATADTGDDARVDGREWAAARDFLSTMSRSRAAQGLTPTETATFVFSLKRPIFTRLAALAGGDADQLARDVWFVTRLVDALGLFTAEIYQKSREEVIQRQQQDLLELSTPVVKLWDGVLAPPLIGTLDSARTQVVMESLLQEIVSSGAGIAIIDITGVPTVDTLVAQHLIKTVTAARLMGADCIISGIRPQIAQTIVHLGVDLTDVTTKATLADAFRVALQRTGQKIRTGASAAGSPTAATPLRA
ncbi:MAG TPA: STAS domain-containing protein [Gemmatimonadaceae bacterium]|nr:STAS domain-containing protein [Gemmatimonadaceae bacterium]